MISPEAWKGRYALTLACSNLDEAMNRFGNTEEDDPLSKEEFGELRKLQRQLRIIQERMRQWPE